MCQQHGNLYLNMLFTHALIPNIKVEDNRNRPPLTWCFSFKVSFIHRFWAVLIFMQF